MSVATGYGSGLFPNGTDFPFISPSSDVKGLFEDLFLSFDDTVNYVYPLKISQVYGFEIGNSSGSYVVISDSADNVVFDGSAASSTYSRWGNDRTIFTWQSARRYLTAVQYVGPGATNKDPNFYPTNGILDARTYQKEAYKVNSIRMGGSYYSGDISLVAGYNIVFKLRSTTEVEGKRKINNIQIGAVAGQGLGIYPDCPEDCVSDAIRSINGIKPFYDGNYSLATNECYWFGVDGIGDGSTYQPWEDRSSIGETHEFIDEDPITHNEDHTLYMKNNCLPCCECDDFVNTYRAIQNLYAQFKEMGDKAMQVRSQHYANNDRWLEGKNCRDQSASSIYALPIAGAAASVLVTFCNTTSNYIGPVRVNVTLDAGGKAGAIRMDSTAWYPSNKSSPIAIDPEGEWPLYSFRWDNIAPGRSGKVRFVVDVDNGDSSDYLVISSVAVLDTPAQEVIIEAEPYSIGLKD